MTDVSKMIEPNSNQLNADDLLTGSMAATITGVEVRNTRDQPISVHLDAFHRPWKPCKSMARVMAAVWGKDSSGWVGQGVTLFNDPDVRWAGVSVGGIRISHITGIHTDKAFNLTVSKGKRKQSIIKPMQAATAPQQQTTQPQQQQANVQQEPAQAITQGEVTHSKATIKAAATMEQLIAVWGSIPPQIRALLVEVKDAKKAELEQPAPEQAQDGIGEF